MRKIKVGVVGVGHIGKFHARIYAELPQAEFVAVLDPNAEAVEEIARLYGVRACSDLAEFADCVDAASVAAPTPAHFEIASELIKRGKHLLVEKPVAQTTREAGEMVALASEFRTVLQVGHVERFNPVMGALEERLTRPRFIEAHRLSPYPNRSIEIGVVLDLMIHDIEAILHLVRSPVESIDAVGIAVLSKDEDIANARIRFRNGCVANLTASRISPEKMRKIRVFQEDAYLSLDYQNQSGEIHRLTPAGIVREEVPIEKGEPLRRELESFVECAATGRKPAVSGQEAADALALALEISGRIRNAEGSRENAE